MGGNSIYLGSKTIIWGEGIQAEAHIVFLLFSTQLGLRVFMGEKGGR